MDAQFAHTIAHGFDIAKVARLHLSQANSDAGLGYFIAQGVQPLGKRFFAVIALISQ
jgi:hypothetical protein